MKIPSFGSFENRDAEESTDNFDLHVLRKITDSLKLQITEEEEKEFIKFIQNEKEIVSLSIDPEIDLSSEEILNETKERIGGRVAEMVFLSTAGKLINKALLNQEEPRAELKSLEEIKNFIKSNYLSNDALIGFIESVAEKITSEENSGNMFSTIVKTAISNTVVKMKSQELNANKQEKNDSELYSYFIDELRKNEEINFIVKSVLNED